MTVALSICICTFRRPALLAALLAELQHMHWDDPRTCELVVVDNDPSLSAMGTLSDWAHISKFRLRADPLGASNIAAARNRLVALATGDRVLFLDDDQHPHDPGWAQALCRTMDSHRADVVFGPVKPLYGAGTPDWVRRAGHFELDPAGMATGTLVSKDLAHSGNALIARHCFEGNTPPFDEAFGRTGGEDSVFFQGLIQRGLKLVWCAEGAVSEHVPPERANAAWLLKRSYREGQTWVRTELHGLPAPAQWRRSVVILARALVALPVSVLLWWLFAPVSKPRGLHWQRKAAGHWGKITHFLGGRYAEYG